MARIRILFALVWLAPAALLAADMTYVPTTIKPPAPLREFRAAWIATVANLDWPSKPGLSVPLQKAELIGLLDRAAQLHLNAVIFQVRSMADAVYVSSLEPWSEFLTGTQGKAPRPFYDPLAFAIQQAHERGLELHAWFNPFRVSLPQAKSPLAWNDIARTHPDWVRHYGNLLWLDPGVPAARQHVLDVIMNVVRRYNIDGVTFDDYFYPYPQMGADGQAIPFPDYASWKKYGLHSGMTRDQWRRANVNGFIQRVYRSIKTVKPWVKFGISPFGIWRPGFPKQIQGLDAYSKIYADSRKWLVNGWLDYFSPQLYWPINPPPQSFPVLLNWWAQQNVKHRHLWPSLDAANVGTSWGPGEIAEQMRIVRRQKGASGEIFYHLRSLLDNRALANVVRAQYAQPALVPASPWLDARRPDKPRLVVVENNRYQLRVHWETAGGEPVWLWVLQFQINGAWTTKILPAHQTAWTFGNPMPNVIAVSAVDRVENEGPAVALRKASLPVRARPDDRRTNLNWHLKRNR